MSHFPGTDRYSNPELEWDQAALARIAAGNLKSLIGYDEDELDDKGNIELRCWACAAGALGERKPDIVSMDPSWHHNYASVAWFSGGSAARSALSVSQAGARRTDERIARLWPMMRPRGPSSLPTQRASPPAFL